MNHFVNFFRFHPWRRGGFTSTDAPCLRLFTTCATFPLISSQHYATRTSTRATSNHPEHLHFAYPSFHTNKFKTHSLINHSIEAWNSLPVDLLSCSLPSFMLNVWSHVNKYSYFYLILCIHLILAYYTIVCPLQRKHKFLQIE